MCGLMSGVGTVLLGMVMLLGWMVVVPVDVTSTTQQEVRPVDPAEIGQVGSGAQQAQVGWRELLTIEVGAGAIHAVDWSPDGARLVSGGDDGVVRIWNATTGEELDHFEGTNAAGPVWSVAWSPDGRTVASGGDDGTVRAWNADMGWSEWLTGHLATWVSAIAWSRDGTRLAAAHSDGAVRVWNSQDGVLLAELTGQDVPVNDVDWDYTGDRIAASGGSGYDDNTVRLWSYAFKQLSHTYWGHLGEVWSVAFSPDGARIASGSTDHTVRVWSVFSGDPLYVFEGHTGPVTAVDWDATGKYVVSAGGDGSLRIWDMEWVGGSMATIFDAHEGWISTVAWAHDGRIASAGADGVILVWGR